MASAMSRIRQVQRRHAARGTDRLQLRRAVGAREEDHVLLDLQPTTDQEEDQALPICKTGSVIGPIRFGLPWPMRAGQERLIPIHPDPS
jgi:hypothetical protein